MIHARSRQRRCRATPRRKHTGNALVFALLGLLISALGAAGILQNNRLQARRDAGNGEATILDHLRNAANNAIFESMTQIQNGAAIDKNGVSVQPIEIDGEQVWQPTVAQLAGMGYLPAGWTTTSSTLNNAPYTIAFKRTPPGCVVAACNIEGHVVLAGPIRSAGGSGADADSDGAVIGPVLTRIGADAGVSLPMSPASITGFGNTWTLVNPVAGQPPGVVAVRVGTASSAFGQFVRFGDVRDPDLAGNLSVAGNTAFGNGTTRSEFRSTLQVDGLPLEVHDNADRRCVTLHPEGVLDVLCNGSLNAGTGSFSDDAGHVSTIGPAGVATGGRVAAADGFVTNAITAFAGADPDSIVVKSGNLAIKNAAGTALLSVDGNGDVTAGGNVHAGQIILTSLVDEGDPCDGGQVAMMRGGGLATCQAARFQATTRYASLGSPCSQPARPATDRESGESLVCRGGYYASVAWLTSSRVYMSSTVVRHGDTVSLAQALPNGCPATASPVAPQAEIYLMPQSDVDTPGNPALNRNASWTANGWVISLTDGTGAGTASVAVAQVFCFYP